MGWATRFRWLRRAGWKLVLLALLVAGCVGRYWTPEPDREVTVTLFAPVGRVTQHAVLTTPTVLGWLIRGRATRVDAWALDADGGGLLLHSIRGSGDVVSDARITSRSADRIGVEVTILDPVLPLPRDAAGYFFVVRVPLDPPVDPSNPPAIMDTGSGGETPVTVTFAVAP